MKLLLDSHVLVWAAIDDPRLRQPVRTIIADPDATVFISIASVWELYVKAKSGRMNLQKDLRQIIAEHGYDLLPVTIDHAEISASLPPRHKDPFDRMLVAQALAENLTLVTNDRHIRQYNVNILAAS